MLFKNNELTFNIANGSGIAESNVSEGYGLFGEVIGYLPCYFLRKKLVCCKQAESNGGGVSKHVGGLLRRMNEIN